jgi:hypothetical protein
MWMHKNGKFIFRSGDQARRWLGGRFQQTTGYIMLWQDKNTYKLEHRVIMEQILGRPLTKTESVHHINGIKDDNRPENLELWDRPQPTGVRASDIPQWEVSASWY